MPSVSLRTKSPLRTCSGRLKRSRTAPGPRPAACRAVPAVVGSPLGVGSLPRQPPPCRARSDHGSAGDDRGSADTRSAPAAGALRVRQTPSPSTSCRPTRCASSPGWRHPWPGSRATGATADAGRARAPTPRGARSARAARSLPRDGRSAHQRTRAARSRPAGFAGPGAGVRRPLRAVAGHVRYTYAHALTISFAHFTDRDVGRLVVRRLRRRVWHAVPDALAARDREPLGVAEADPRQ
jgi:hypothetical protein